MPLIRIFYATLVWNMPGKMERASRTIRYLESIGLWIVSIHGYNTTNCLNVKANLGFILNYVE